MQLVAAGFARAAAVDRRCRALLRLLDALDIADRGARAELFLETSREGLVIALQQSETGGLALDIDQRVFQAITPRAAGIGDLMLQLLEIDIRDLPRRGRNDDV